jgi:lysozyme
MKVSRRGTRFIAQFEGFVPVASIAFPGEPYPTYGYGHMGPDVKVGERITKRQARKLLRRDLNKTFAPGVSRALRVKTGQKQFDAIVSFAYNVGVGGLTSSTFLRRWNSGEHKCRVAKEELPKWVKGSNGQVYPGLVTRRAAEARLICEGKYT